ncbi:MAG TPA: aspartate aminotransferase family protein [Stellaceae bacterium]|nr:aspartate aminotransferase family protein [Stellaceae bacterium]
MTSLGNSTASRDIANVLHPYTNLKKHQTSGPLVMARGKGVYVYDDTGKEYIEAMAGLWCTSLGFGEERLVEAATKQLRALPYYHTFNHKGHEPSVELAERLIRLAPMSSNGTPMSKVFFNNSGSEANDTAVKLVWYYNNALGRHRKKKIISRMKGYHGVTVATASLTGLPNNHRDFDLPIENIRHADCPHYYRFGKPGESEEDFATRLAESLEAQILREGPDTVAAFIAEPVQGAGGVIVPPATYWQKIQPILKKYDILLIADEVICGFGRTGKMFGSQTYGMTPDIMSVAKALSSAYLPISATLISDQIYQALVKQSEKIGVFAHGYTYSGHPVCAAVAIETLKIYEERDIVTHVNAVSPRLLNGLQRLKDRPLVGEIRGVGLIAAVELVRDKTSRASFDASAMIGAYFQGRAEGHGLIVRAMGDAIALCPPLIVTETEIDEILIRFDKALADTEAMVASSGLAAVA